MPNGNKTLNIQYRFLSQKDFSILYKTNLAAFADYFIPVQMTVRQFENHIAQNAVDLELSVGAFFGDKLIGYTLTGFGDWNGIKTAYDAGTGVTYDFRRKGVAASLFEFLLPNLKKIGIQQMLLEVISKNEKAIKLYQKLGFKEARKLLFYEQTKKIKPTLQSDIQVRRMEKPDWEYLKNFWDGNTSWQFSSESIERKISSKTFLGAYSEDKCVGYGVFYQKSGTVSQIAVDKDHRRKNIAPLLLLQMQRMSNNKLRFCNVDSNLKSVVEFVEKLKFKQTISQIEMILPL